MDNSTRSVHVCNLGPVSTQQLCHLANAFGAIESVVFQSGSSSAFINFVHVRDAMAVFAACNTEPCFIGQAPVTVQLASPPPEDQLLNQHISSGATRSIFLTNYGVARAEEIETAFRHYCAQFEFVFKGTYSFINTESIATAVQARAALNNTVLGGSPIQISHAKEVETKREAGQLPLLFQSAHHRPLNRSKPSIGTETRNLHVTNFGEGTTAADLRTLFAQITPLHDVVIKSSYAFVNTMSVGGAVRAMGILQGHLVLAAMCCICVD